MWKAQTVKQSRQHVNPRSQLGLKLVVYILGTLGSCPVPTPTVHIQAVTVLSVTEDLVGAQRNNGRTLITLRVGIWPSLSTNKT